MQTPGMFIEYLINGSVALVWVLPILKLLEIPTPKETATAALLLPGLYVIGMIIDYFGWFISRSYKGRLKGEALKGSGLSDKDTDILQPNVFIYAPELAKASEMRGSRDRIARGTFINIVVTTILLSVYSSKLEIPLSPLYVVILGSILSMLCGLMWVRFQRLAYEYELRGMVAVREKINADRERQASSAPKPGA